MRVLVATGPSGGHIFPALSFLDSLKNQYRDIDTFLILPKINLLDRIALNNYNVRYISVSAVRLNFDFKNFIALLSFFKGSLQSLFLLLEFQPDTVVGFGALSSVPIVLWAWILRIRILIHEQNVIPGRANRLLAKFSDKIAVSFAQTKNYLQDYSQKIVLTGNPIRGELKKIAKDKALDFLGLSPDKFTLLVMGGSLGSHRINLQVLKALSTIRDNFGLQIIHLAGVKDYDFLKDKYKGLTINIKLFAFLPQMQYAYCASDLAICRAGATTVTEIAFFGLPAIVIPYPFAYRHQLSNAKVLEKEGCAIIIQDDELEGNILQRRIEEFMSNPDKIKKMRANHTNLARPDGNTLLVKEVLALNSRYKSIRFLTVHF